MKILVTGGAGFLGSNLVDALMKVPDNIVTVFDDLSAGKMDNIQNHLQKNNFKFIKGDVRNLNMLNDAFSEVDIVYHLAAQCVPLSIYNPSIVHEVNATGTFNVCAAARNAKLGRLVHIASSEVYGSASYVPMDERHPFEPTTPYGASKVAGELYVTTFVKTYGLDAIVVRPFNSYGPRLPYEGPYGNVIPKFVTRILAGKPPVIYGDGKQTRDFTYVTDTVKGIIKASMCDDLIGQAVNIANGRETSVIEIAGLVTELLEKRQLKPKFIEARPGDVRRHFADIAKAREMLSYNPEIDIKTGVSRYIQWFQSTGINPQNAAKTDWERTWSPENKLNGY